MVYKYVGYNTDQRMVKGRIDAESESSAEKALARSGFRVVSLRRGRAGLDMEKLLPSIYGIKRRQIFDFFSQLATLVECGIALMPALKFYEEQVRGQAMRRVMASIIADLGSGSSFSEALGKHPEVFPPLYQRMVGVGEQSGNLDVMLRRAAKQMEKDDVLMKKVGRAMAYPAMVMLMAMGVMVLLVTVALPPIIGLFEGMMATLPFTTRVLVGFMNFLKGYPLEILMTITAVAALYWILQRRPAVRSRIDRFMLMAPLIGPMNMATDMSRLTRTMSLLLEAGLPLLEVLGLGAETVGNREVRAALRRVGEESSQGKGLHGPLAEAGVFPPLLVNIIKVGEETGSLGPTLATLANAYEREAEERITGLTTFLEPAMTVGIALVVGFIALSVVTPIYSLMGIVE